MSDPGSLNILDVTLAQFAAGNLNAGQRGRRALIRGLELF